MTDGVILAIDQGTTNTKAIAVDAAGTIVAQASVPMSVNYPKPGWAEQSATEIWQSVQRAIADVVAKTTRPIEALAISNQRESIVVWDVSSGEPIAPAVSWQCRRSAERCETLRSAGHNAEIVDRTGLALDPLFPAAKIAWIIDEIPGARIRAQRGELKAGTIDSWLLWKLTGGRVHATDHSNASRTQLFGTRSLMWDEELGRLFDVPINMLPRVMRSDSHFGDIATGVTAVPAGTPIRSMIGDSHAALFGHGIREPGAVKATYGTGSSLMTLTPKRVSSSHGLSGTIAWSTKAGVSYALEGNISVSGQAAAFMTEILGLSDVAVLSRLAATVSDTNGVSFVPALVGLGAPHWRDDVRGVINGLSLGTKRAHLARAALEAIAFQVADVFRALEDDLGMDLDRLAADGGASRNDFLMQFQADVLGCPIARSDIAELSALGAARLAAPGLGWPANWEISPPTVFEPTMSPAERAAAVDRWRAAVGQAMA